MAEAFQFGFGDPSNFSDFAKYAGFDRKTGGISALDLGSAEGVPPPQNMQELFDQKVAQPFQNKVAGVQQSFQNMSNAASQIGQGNFVQGMNAARGIAPVQQATQTVMPSTNWKMDHDLD